jgi:NAD(P) transhydrogenase subunit alpha
MSFQSLVLLAAASPTEGAERTPPDYLALLFVFALATFTGLLVIRNVSRLLHTPLMSLTNAISAIAVVGSIVLAGNPVLAGGRQSTFTTVLGTIAVIASMTNIVSGFLLTDRMLKMFKKREPSKS